MKQRLFVCCDGTWNSDSDEFQGVPVPTNVVRFYNSVRIGNIGTCEQMAYYHVGVGANVGRIPRMIDGAFGLGLARDIRSAYKWLSDHYSDGDEIFIVGFSRGAFTARSLVGMLHHCGLAKADASQTAEDAGHTAKSAKQRSKQENQRVEKEWGLVKEAWQLYRLDPTRQANLDRQQQFREEHGKCPAIRFLGVWDTVGALGIPESFDPLRILAGRYRFHDLGLAPEVQRAVQALAIDEERNNFFPTLWEFKEPPEPGRVSQVWFPGVHADVGGGYRETQLSDFTLKWMIDEATTCGAVFEPDMLAQVDSATKNFGACMHGVAHNSLTGLFREIGYRPRSVPKIAPGVGRNEQQISNIALARQLNPPIAQAPYRPNASPFDSGGIVVRVFARPLWNWTGVYIEKDNTYSFQVLPNQGWLDWHLPSGADGWPPSWFGSLMSWAKRDKDANWFELCGAIMVEGEPTVGGVPPAPYLIRIGNTRVFKAEDSGYLYCFANAIPGTYWKNRGSVLVRIVASKSAQNPPNTPVSEPAPPPTLASPVTPGGSGIE